MELFKDIMKIIIEGIAEFIAENKISEKRKEYFRHKKGKWPKIWFYISMILALVLVIVGLIQIIQKKTIGILLLCAGMGIGSFMIVEWATAER